MFSVSHFLWDPLVRRSWIYSFNKCGFLCTEADIETVQVLDDNMINKANTPILFVFTVRGVSRSLQERSRWILGSHGGVWEGLSQERGSHVHDHHTDHKRQDPVAFLTPTQTILRKEDDRNLGHIADTNIVQAISCLVIFVKYSAFLRKGQGTESSRAYILGDRKLVEVFQFCFMLLSQKIHS